MNQTRTLTLSLALCTMALAPLLQAEEMTAEQKIANAMSAAPATLAKDATVMDWPAKEGDKLAMLREGSNGWTCLPDNPGTPGNDPMCLDKQWMAWLDAYVNHTEPVKTTVGLAYMLQGGTDASNTDPYATAPAAGEEWMVAAPHVMVIMPGKLDPALHSSDPHTGGPWLMWGGTPYEHLMMPVADAAK